MHQLSIGIRNELELAQVIAYTSIHFYLISPLLETVKRILQKYMVSRTDTKRKSSPTLVSCVQHLCRLSARKAESGSVEHLTISEPI